MDDRTLSVSREPVSLTVWIAQGFLFVAFGVLGAMQLTMTIPALTDILTWPSALPVWLVRLIGAAEIAGAIGILVPAITGIQPWLTRWAAFGLAAIMGFALGYHLMLFQGMMMLPSLVLGGIAVYVGVRRM